MSHLSNETPARVECISKVCTMQYPVHKVKKNALGRIVKMHTTTREELKLLEGVLPPYNKRKYRASERLSLALSFAAYLEGKIAASAPENCPVPSNMVPIISEFSMYYLTDPDKSDEETQLENVSGAETEENTETDTQVDQREAGDQNVDLLDYMFPELEPFVQHNDVLMQTCCSMDGTWCCCPESAVREQKCHTTMRGQGAGNRSRKSKPDTAAQVQADEVHLKERVSYVNKVLKRMECAVKVAQNHATRMSLPQQ